LLEGLEGIEGFDRKNFDAVHESGEQITSIRFNPEKFQLFMPGKNYYHPCFKLEQQVPWCEHGFYLSERPSFTLDPLLHAGAYYVQEASSMFLWEVLKQTVDANANMKVLDLCAAPGGKSSLLASWFINGLVVSNEVIRSRVNILYENMTKWGASNIVITNNEAKDFQRLKNYFDVILVDAPCSGSGLFRKDPEAIEQWSENMVELCSQRQQKILSDIFPSLKDEGILIYSTCSYSPEEDEEISDWLKDHFSVDSIQLKLDPEWNVVEIRSSKHRSFGYRFWPDKVKGEGFFIAAFRKNEAGRENSRQRKSSLRKTGTKESSIVSNFVCTAADWLLFSQNENIHAIKAAWESDIALLQKTLYLKKAGIRVGQIKGNELVPHHELALSGIINKNVQRTALSPDEALQYLRKKELNITGVSKGWALCTCYNFSLGWIKFLHNRVNNYYPTEWRILKQ